MTLQKVVGGSITSGGGDFYNYPNNTQNQRVGAFALTVAPDGTPYSVYSANGSSHVITPSYAANGQTTFTQIGQNLPGGQVAITTNAAGTPAVVNMPPTGAGIRRIMNAAT